MVVGTMRFCVGESWHSRGNQFSFSLRFCGAPYPAAASTADSISTSDILQQKSFWQKLTRFISHSLLSFVWRCTYNTRGDPVKAQCCRAPAAWRPGMEHLPLPCCRKCTMKTTATNPIQGKAKWSHQHNYNETLNVSFIGIHRECDFWSTQKTLWDIESHSAANVVWRRN